MKYSNYLVAAGFLLLKTSYVQPELHYTSVFSSYLSGGCSFAFSLSSEPKIACSVAGLVRNRTGGGTIDELKKVAIEELQKIDRGRLEKMSLADFQKILLSLAEKNNYPDEKVRQMAQKELYQLIKDIIEQVLLRKMNLSQIPATSVKRVFDRVKEGTVLILKNVE